MSMAESRGASRRHPFVAAQEARDLPALSDTLADDVVLHPPVVLTTFNGSETVGELFAADMESFEEFEVVEELSSGDTYVFFWRGRMEGRFVEGAYRFRLDSAGRVGEITVVGRPFSGLAGFMTGTGPRFARRRRGPFVATMMRLSWRPLVGLYATLEPVTRWVIRGGRRGGKGSA